MARHRRRRHCRGGRRRVARARAGRLRGGRRTGVPAVEGLAARCPRRAARAGARRAARIEPAQHAALALQGVAGEGRAVRRHHAPPRKLRSVSARNAHRARLCAREHAARRGRERLHGKRRARTRQPGDAAARKCAGARRAHRSHGAPSRAEPAARRDCLASYRPRAVPKRSCPRARSDRLVAPFGRRRRRAQARAVHGRRREGDVRQHGRAGDRDDHRRRDNGGRQRALVSPPLERRAAPARRHHARCGRVAGDADRARENDAAAVGTDDSSALARCDARRAREERAVVRPDRRARSLRPHTGAERRPPVAAPAPVGDDARHRDAAAQPADRNHRSRAPARRARQRAATAGAADDRCIVATDFCVSRWLSDTSRGAEPTPAGAGGAGVSFEAPAAQSMRRGAPDLRTETPVAARPSACR